MNSVLDYPPAILVATFVPLWLAAYIGDALRRRRHASKGGEQSEYATILPAALTLLALIVGFTFSMAVSRYDLRKNYEEAEANAIGTEYVRADFLDDTDAARVHQLLTKYAQLRIRFYGERSPKEDRQIDKDTVELQDALWTAVISPVRARPTPISALIMSGMNDVLNSQGYTQAAWLNRVPVGAWVLMGLVAVACNFLLGYSERHSVATTLLIFPLILTVAFVLVADIDSPRGGIIRVVPQNLIVLLQTMK
jgi:hypothetical protein